MGQKKIGKVDQMSFIQAVSLLLKRDTQGKTVVSVAIVFV